MPSAPSRPEHVLASCSFCGKADTEVERLVAGPGVYICNECIGLSAAVLEDAARTTPEESARRRARFHDRPTEDVLATLPALVRSADRVNRELAGWVDLLRERGTDWRTIAAAVGTSVEAVRLRFGEEPSG